MSILIALAAGALVSTAGPAEAAASSTKVEPSRTQQLHARPAGDEDIRRDLWRALEQNPERVVCSTRAKTGTRIPRPTCGTLRRWFDARILSEVQNEDAPWQLVEEIKEQRRKALAEARSAR
jgi:hypothetical protein